MTRYWMVAICLVSSGCGAAEDRLRGGGGGLAAANEGDGPGQTPADADVGVGVGDPIPEGVDDRQGAGDPVLETPDDGEPVEDPQSPGGADDDEDEFGHQGPGGDLPGDGKEGGGDDAGPGDDPIEGDGDPVEEVPVTVEQCFAETGGDLGPDYAQFEPTVGSHCHGTNHQDIQDIERLVFLGDSVTVGTPPWLITDYYWVRLYEALKLRFGADLEVQNCAKWGARTDDLLEGKNEIAECFPDGGDDRKTLVVMTIGGNDLAAWASNNLGVDEALAEADLAAEYLDDALAWFREPERFPNGVQVIVGNPYEYTDATGDVDSCFAAGFAGLEGNWIEGAPAVIHLHERFMEMSVRHGTDLVFLLEAFCGHGYHHDDPESQCYRGPDAELWFDFTCIHPNPTGHAVIAQMFEAVVAE